ncbi:MAG: hypothetical protein ACRD3T_21625 [Terriglobia bacterium]
MRLPLRVCLLSILAMSAFPALPRTGGWSQIRPVHIVSAITAPPRGMDTPFLIYIQDLHGAPVYKFECHSGNYPDDDEYAFSGDFQCSLFAYKSGRVTSWNLLAADTKDETSSDWWNRGRMMSYQLRGRCLAYPEYSTDRHFRLRGMLITLKFTDVRWNDQSNNLGKPILVGFTFTLDVVPDRSARTSRAELPAGPRPPASCYP